MSMRSLENVFSDPARLRPFAFIFLVCFVSMFLGAASAAAQQEQILFPSHDDAKAAIINKIRNEQVRLDISGWYFTDREITLRIVERFQAGIPVRVLGDRVSIFEIDQKTRTEFEYMANAGVPIRLRYHPTWFPYINHWKCGIFVGQNTVEFGSANWTTFELVPWSSTNFKDETAMFTDDPALVNAFKTTFDRMWADTTDFLDWPAAYKLETGQNWTTPMTISRARLVPDYPSPAGMVWEQGTVLTSAMASAIDQETQRIDFVIYRLSVPNITDALIRRINAGVPVRVFVEPTQYRNIQWPEYWLTGARVDQLWVAGAQIKERVHDGLTHMKVLITSTSALQGSSNFTKNWQRDHNYFVPLAQKPVIYWAIRDEFERMWGDTVNYRTFYPKPPNAATLAAPADGVSGTSVTPKLEWKRAPWAVAYDVYLGTAQNNLVFQARVNAQLEEDPPQTYSWTATQALQPGIRYYWKVVSRTFATAVDPSLVAASAVRSFVTSGSGGGGTPTPFGGVPAALPGTIQAENFDEGGPSIAYFDATAGNSGGQYRVEDVDIEATGDTGGGFNVGWMSPGEWLKYTVDVGSSGTYDIEARVAANGSGGTFHIEANGVDKTGPLAIPDTGGWQSWTTVSKTGVSLSAGQQVWRLVIDGAGPTGVVGNVNLIRVVASGGPPPPPPPPPAPPPEIVIYAADVPAANVHGNWSVVSDVLAAAGLRLASTDLGVAAVDPPRLAPADYFDVTFQAQAGVRYRVWLRMNAAQDTKWNDSLWVQFSGAVNSSGSPVYRIGTAQGLNVNMATCSTCAPAGWGWHNGAYWLPDTGEVWFATSGTQTIRIQLREDGVSVDQIVISPQQYLSTPPGPKFNDSTIVPKP